MTADRFHGLIVVDKPAGWTSHDVVGRIRRLLKQRSVGHAGTLDPAATGVLPIAVGHATKTLEYLSDASKWYLAEVILGLETDSYDLDGHLVSMTDVPPLSQHEIEALLAGFQGPQEQVPPMHSAIKIGGQRLYALARKGEIVERPARQITIQSIALVEWAAPVMSFVVHCSKGTYIRSIAKDIGDRLGAGAVLSNLVRLGVGHLTLNAAWSLSALEELPVDELWETVALHPDSAAMHLPAAVLNHPERRSWSYGQSIAFETAETDETVRVYDSDGNWIGIGQVDAEKKALRPTKVVLSAA
jgi:tRNA pseudouridine55 synthase